MGSCDHSAVRVKRVLAVPRDARHHARARVGAAAGQWKERGVQKALSKVAHARIFNAEAAREKTPCGHCDATFDTAEHYQTHALTVRAGTAGGSTYNTHNYILEAVANCAKAVGVAYSIGSTHDGVRNNDANCRLGTYTNPNGTRNVKHADIAFLNMPPSAFDAQRVYGDVTHRTVVGLSGGNPTPMYGAHLRAGAALQHADAEKTRVYDEALLGRQNEKVAILGIEAGGRMHKHFHRLIDTFAKFKADADAGPLDANASPASTKFHQSVFSRTKAFLMGRIQVARVKCVAGRIMWITCPHNPRPRPASSPASPARVAVRAAPEI